jgi:hypothetical protein
MTSVGGEELAELKKNIDDVFILTNAIIVCCKYREINIFPKALENVNKHLQSLCSGLLSSFYYALFWNTLN